MKTHSIAQRLMAAVIISQLLLAIGLFFVALYFTHRQLLTAFDTELHGRAMSIAALVHYSEDEHPTLEFQQDMLPPPFERRNADLYEVFDQTGRLIARSKGWPSVVLPSSLWPTYTNFDWNGETYRSLRLSHVPVLDREANTPASDFLTVTYASPLTPVNRTIGRLRLYIAGGCVLLLCITVPFAIWGLRRALRPLDGLAASATSISPSNWELNPSAEAITTRELLPLTSAMTSMLEGLHRAFTQQREFLANAAHELKTPVAILKSTLQSLLQRPRSSEEYRAGLEQCLDDIARLEKLLHSMLRLARAEQWAAGSLQRDLSEVDLRTTCEAAVDSITPLARQHGIDILISSNGRVAVRADSEDLELVWANLLENAVRFTPENSTVRVRVGSDGQHGIVEICDSGPGIPPEELPRIFERFHRGDVSRSRETGGYGLGLAISKAVIEAYGGSVTPKSEVGVGTSMIVAIPKQS
jgi:signal transduction histidine kinase